MHTKKAWIVTKKGIAFLKKCAVAASVGVFCYEVCPHTVLIPFKRARQEEAQQARLGLKELPYQVQEYVRRALDDMKFTEDQRKTLSVYLADLNEVETYGNVNNAFGALVKLPWMLWDHYPIPDYIKGEDGKHPEASKEYLESLKWSDKAKLYCAAYQVAWTTHYKFLAQGVFNAVGLTSASVACYLFSRGKNYITDKPSALIILNLVILAMFHVSWMLATDLTSCDNEEQIIRQVCSLGPDYAEGAVEFYKKLQQHNKAIREIVGFVGRLKYNEQGNTRSPRRVSIPLDERTVMAQEYVEKYQNKDQSSTNKKDEKK